MNENEEKIVDVEIVNENKAAKGNPKEKRNAIIICSVGAVILLGTVIIPVIGHFANQISPSKKASPSFSWDTQTPGLYTENGLFRTNSNVFKIEKDGERYVVLDVNATEEDKYLIMPSAVNISAENKVYPISEVTLKEETNSNVFGSSDIKIKGIYFSGLYSKIGANTFQNLSDLEEVKFASASSGVQNIESNAFANNKSLKNISFAKNLISIGKNAFENDISITSLDFSATSLQTLSANAFAGCTALTSVVLPSTLSSLSEGIFSGCSSLETINYSSTMASWKNLVASTNWDKDSSIESIVCSDGTIVL